MSPQVLYVIKYNPQGKIENATVSVVLGFVTEAVLHLEQEFQVTYIQVYIQTNLCMCNGLFFWNNQSQMF